MLGSCQEFDDSVTVTQYGRLELLVLPFGFRTSDFAGVVLRMSLSVPFSVGGIALLLLFELARLSPDINLGFALGLESQLFHGIVAALQHMEAVKHDCSIREDR